MEEEVREWYKWRYLWLRESKAWEHDYYGFSPEGLSDCIFNTCNKIIVDEDESSWAECAIVYCSIQLQNHRRWPDALHPDRSAKNWFQWKWDKLLVKMGIRKLRLYRPQGNETRDNYIAFYTACMFHGSNFGVGYYIKNISPPIHLYAPSTWSWIKYIRTGNFKYLKRYRFWQKFSSNKHEYVRRLDELRELAIKLKL